MARGMPAEWLTLLVIAAVACSPSAGVGLLALPAPLQRSRGPLARQLARLQDCTQRQQALRRSPLHAAEVAGH